MENNVNANGEFLSKLPLITAGYWVIKICSTTLGETGADHLSMTLNAGYAVSSLIFLSVFLVTLGMQLYSKKFNPVIYWLVFTSTSVAGTTISDFMDRTLGLGYGMGTFILITFLLITLSVWYFSESSLSVTNIKTRKGEIFYWIAFLIANTLGTALGDFLADSSGLGFAGGAILISSLLVVTLSAYFLTKISPIALFWIAFVLTRPFGATFGDLLTKSPEQGGLGFGTLGASLILTTLLAVFVIKSCWGLEKTENLRNCDELSAENG